MCNAGWCRPPDPPRPRFPGTPTAAAPSLSLERQLEGNIKGIFIFSRGERSLLGTGKERKQRNTDLEFGQETKGQEEHSAQVAQQVEERGEKHQQPCQQGEEGVEDDGDDDPGHRGDGHGVPDDGEGRSYVLPVTSICSCASLLSPGLPLYHPYTAHSGFGVVDDVLITLV